MLEHAPFIDASVFLGMHHEHDSTRERSLAFFRDHFDRGVRMSYEQIGICDAIIWRQSREVQDLYYPFMDCLHSEMRIHREGYLFEELGLVLEHHELRALGSAQALLAAQVLHREGVLFTHDPALRSLPCLRSRLGAFEGSLRGAAFPAELQKLYHTSLSFVHTAKDWSHVDAWSLRSPDHPA
jgi:hypothetical protein